MTRQKKRRYKAATKQAKKRERSSETAQRWYLTLASKPGLCAGCSERFGRGAEIVYRNMPPQVLCQECADRRKIFYRPSLRWEQAKRKAAA